MALTDDAFEDLARQVESAIPAVHCAQCLYFHRRLDAAPVCQHPHAVVIEERWDAVYRVRILPHERNADLCCPDYVQATLWRHLAAAPLQTALGIVVWLLITGTLGWALVYLLMMGWRR